MEANPVKKKLLTILLALCLTASLLTGCVGDLPGNEPSEAPPQTSEAPETESPETDAPVQTEATEAPALEPAPYFTMVADESCNHFTNEAIDILFRPDRSVVRVDLATGEEETLFTVGAPNDGLLMSLIGVTADRLYFGWNEAEDWWGVDVYSVDYRGGDQRDFGSAWEPSFEDGWLVLLGFRSDVSPTEMMLISPYDEVVAQDQTGAVWDAMVYEDAAYYIFIQNLDEDPWAREEAGATWTFSVIEVDADGRWTEIGAFGGMPHYYSPAFFNGTVICFYELNEYYDLLTMQPTEKPFD